MSVLPATVIGRNIVIEYPTHEEAMAAIGSDDMPLCFDARHALPVPALDARAVLEAWEAAIEAVHRAWIDCGNTGWKHNGGRPCAMRQHADAARAALAKQEADHE